MLIFIYLYKIASVLFLFCNIHFHFPSQRASLFKRAIKAGAERRQQDDLRLAELKAEEKALLKEKGAVEEEEEDPTSAFSRIAS